MRFCFLTTFYPPYNFGGDGINIQRLARALVRRGHGVTVVYERDAFRALTREPEPRQEEEADGVTTVAVESGWGVLAPIVVQQTGRPLLSRHRLKALLEQGFDVIHYHNISLAGGPGVLGYSDAVKLFTAHEHWLICPTHTLWRHGKELCTSRECFRCQLSYRRPPQWWRHTGWWEKQLRHVDTFIALSEFSRAKHREFGFPRDMAVLPCFLPEPALAEAGARPQERPYFFFAGRLEKIKGLDDVIPVFRGYRDGDLLIAGGGEHGAALRAAAAGMEGVKFLGRLTGPELARHYRHAVATLVPSVCYETFGATIIESFQQSTPVIARKIGPAPELVERAQGGLLFETAAELPDALRKMQNDAGYRAHAAAAGRQAFLEHWSEDAVLPRYLQLVRQAAESRGRRLPE